MQELLSAITMDGEVSEIGEICTLDTTEAVFKAGENFSVSRMLPELLMELCPLRMLKLAPPAPIVNLLVLVEYEHVKLALTVCRAFWIAVARSSAA